MEQILDIVGCKVWTISEGEGIPFLICNGGPGCDDYLKPVSVLIEDIRPTWPTQQLAALIPNGEYVEIADAAHYIWLTHADELGQALQNAILNIRRLSSSFDQL